MVVSQLLKWVKSNTEVFDAVSHIHDRKPFGTLDQLFSEKSADQTWRNKFFAPIWVAVTLLANPQMQLTEETCTTSTATVDHVPVPPGTAASV